MIRTFVLEQEVIDDEDRTYTTRQFHVVQGEEKYVSTYSFNQDGCVPFASEGWRSNDNFQLRWSGDLLPKDYTQQQYERLLQEAKAMAEKIAKSGKTPHIYKKGDKVLVTEEEPTRPERNGPGTVIQPAASGGCNVKIDHSGVVGYFYKRELQPLNQEGEERPETKQGVKVYKPGDRVLVKEKNIAFVKERNGPGTMVEVVKTIHEMPGYAGLYRVKIDDGDGQAMSAYGTEMQPLIQEEEKPMPKTEQCLSTLVEEIALQQLSITDIHGRIRYAENNQSGHTGYTIVRLAAVRDAILAAYHRGLENVNLEEQVVVAKEEELAEKYLLDFSQASYWPVDLLDYVGGSNLLLLRASASGRFDVELYDKSAFIPYEYDLSIEGDYLVLTGKADDCSYNNGSCVVKTDKEEEDGTSGSRLYTITIIPDHEDCFRSLKQKLEGYGVRFIPQGDVDRE